MRKLLIVLSTALIMVGCASSPQHESFGQYMDSSTITTKVKTQLLADADIKSLPITVNTYKNTVQLSGFVNSKEQSRKAAAIAKNVVGVEQVDNNLIVKHK